MKINIVTSELKKANRYLNISLLISAFFTLLFFISFWFPKSDLMKSIYLISLFATGFFTVVSIILSIFRQNKKQTIELGKSDIVELTINSQSDSEKITKKAEIQYVGNEIKTNIDSNIFEVDNTTAFELLIGGTNLKTINRTKKSTRFDMSPKALFNDLMSILWASS